MEFFNQLLTSYSLLKKRKLHITLDEAKGPGRRSSIRGYSDLESLAGEGDPRAVSVKNTVDSEMNSFTPEVAKGSGTARADGYWEIAGPFDGQPITILSPNEELIANSVKSYRNQLAWKYWEEALGGEVGVEGGQPLDPDTQELLSNKSVPGILNLNTEDDTIGTEIVASMARLSKVARSLGEDTYNALFSQDKAYWQTSIPTKIQHSLFGEEVPISTAEEAEKGSVISYERPEPEQIKGALDNLTKVLELYTKTTDPNQKITQDELDFLKDTTTRVTYKKQRHEKFRLFVKSSLSDNLGLSFDWDVRDKPTVLQTLMSKLENNLELGQESWGLDDVSLPYVDRTEAQYNGTLNGVGQIIGDISEDIDTILVLMQQGNVNAAGKEFHKLHTKFGDNLLNAFKLSEEDEEGLLIGTDQTTVLNKSIAQIRELWDLEGTPNKDSIKKAFGIFTKTIFSYREKDMKKMDPDFVCRVGGREAGKEGRKLDQILFYRDPNKAKKISRKSGSKVKSGVLKDILSKEELSDLKSRWSDVNDDMEVSYISDSLKWTNEDGRVNLGSVASPLEIARTFSSGKDSYHNKLLSKLTTDPALKQQVQDNFATIAKDIENLNTVFEKEGVTLTSGAAKKSFVGSLTEQSLSELGLTKKEVAGLKSDIGKPSFDLKAFKQKVEYGLITSRIRRGSVKDPSWRVTGAAILLRGCYDTSESDEVVQNYITGRTTRYHNNNIMLDRFKHYVDTGEGYKDPTKEEERTGAKSFSVGGYTAHFTMNKKTGHTSFNMDGPVPKSMSESEEYSNKYLLDKLLEVQQLIYSNLVKE